MTKAKPKKLTQKQAWLAIARYFRRKAATGGICGAYRRLHQRGRISWQLESQLYMIMDRRGPGDGSREYWWPATPAGNAERVKFCLARAKEAKR